MSAPDEDDQAWMEALASDLPLGWLVLENADGVRTLALVRELVAEGQIGEDGKPMPRVVSVQLPGWDGPALGAALTMLVLPKDVLEAGYRVVGRVELEPPVYAGSSPPIAHVLQFFRYDHLPQRLQDVSKPFADLAHRVACRSANPETTVALRKLLEAKDAAVRAVLP